MSAAASANRVTSRCRFCRAVLDRTFVDFYQTRPDYVVILPWNLTDEIVEQMSRIRDWGGRFIVPIPRVRVLELNR